MTMNEDLLPLPIEMNDDCIIKVVGVGGGGCNAVNYMYHQGIRDVSFLVCNTDRQVLEKSSVPAKLQLGPGLGAGGEPEQAKKFAEDNRERIYEALDDGTQMIFITAGMGGGTGTGASPVIASVAKEMGILTVAIVTLPFAFERRPQIEKAMRGVATLSEYVDALLVINNEKLIQIYPDLTFMNAFAKSDDVLCNAAKSIAEIITVPGYINTDFADVRNTLKDGGVAIMNVGQASGDERITKAIENALTSPLVNSNDVRGAKRVLLQVYFSAEHALQMKELNEINHFMDEVGPTVEVKWGTTIDDSLEEDVRVTIIATGYSVSDIPTNEMVDGRPTIEEAISQNYPETVSGPREDEQSVQMDLTVQIGQMEEIPEQPTELEPEEQPVPDVTSETSDSSSASDLDKKNAEIEISLDGNIDSVPVNPKEESSRSWHPWRR